MKEQDNLSWTVSGQTVTLEDIELDDGRKIGANIELEGIWDDGAFDYEYGSIRGVHRDPLMYSLDRWEIDQVWDMTENKFIIPDQPTLDIIQKVMESIEDQVCDAVNENGPDED